MATIPAVTNGTRTQLQPFGKTLDAKFRSLDLVNLAPMEESLGMLLTGQYLARAAGWDNLIFCAYLAQRERLVNAGVKTDLEGMLGKHAPGTAVRQILTADLAMSLEVKERKLRCRVPSDSKSLPPFAAFLNEAVAKIVKEDALGKAPVPPKYLAVGVGTDIESSSGHSPKLKQILAERLKALQPPAAI